MAEKLELVCPAGNPAALRIAVDEGADAVYAGFKDETNARNFPGLNFSRQEMADAVQYAHNKGCKLFVAINTYAEAGRTAEWKKAIEDSARIGADAVILADIGMLEYAKRNFPELRLHLSVQASASNPESINFFVDNFGVKRVVLPRVLSVAEIAAINKKINVETEVFAFGGMCPMAEGRCSLSSYITGLSPNKNGVCSPASHVEYKQEAGALATRLGGFTINRFADDEPAGYPTLCKGRFELNGNPSYIFEDPVSLNVASITDSLAKAGVKALKIEGRQRGKAYVRDVVRTLRAIIDKKAEQRDTTEEEAFLSTLSEGQKSTVGAYEKKWR